MKNLFTSEELKSYTQRAYECAKAHGFNNDASDDRSLWLVITELAEMTEADRRGRRASLIQFEEGIYRLRNAINNPGVGDNDVFESCFVGFIKDAVEDELADACIRLLNLSGAKGYIPHIVDVHFNVGVKDIPEFCYKTAYLLSRPDYDLYTKIDLGLSTMFDYAERSKIDLRWHIEQKMRYNELRPMKNGKVY